MNGQFEQAIGNVQNPASVFLMRQEELHALSSALTQMTVQPLPTSLGSVEENDRMRDLEMRFWCSQGTSHEDEEVRIQCDLDASRSVTGASSTLDPDDVHVSVVCSLRHAFKEGQFLPCTKLIHIGKDDQSYGTLFEQAHWDAAIQAEVEGALWSVIHASASTGERGSQGQLEHRRFGLPLPYDDGSVHEMRFTKVACCPTDASLPCPQPWDTWSKCTKPCGGGKQFRGRDVYVVKEDDSVTVKRETQKRPCNVQDCCTFGSCVPKANDICRVYYGDGPEDFVWANSSKEQFAIALGRLGKHGTTVLEGGTRRGTKAPNTQLCDGLVFTGDTCSYSESCKELEPQECTLPCSLELPAHVDPKIEVEDFPNNLDEFACGSIKAAIHAACTSGNFSSDACSQFLSTDFSLERFMGACRRSDGGGMIGVVVDPAAATACRAREISDRTIDSILNQLDVLMSDGNRMKNISSSDIMYDIRCCTSNPRTGKNTPLQDALGCERDTEADSGQGLQSSSSQTKAVRSSA